MAIFQQEQVLEARKVGAGHIHMSDAIEEYIIQLIMATRQPEAYHNSLA